MNWISYSLCWVFIKLLFRFSWNENSTANPAKLSYWPQFWTVFCALKFTSAVLDPGLNEEWNLVLRASPSESRNTKGDKRTRAIWAWIWPGRFYGRSGSKSISSENQPMHLEDSISLAFVDSVLYLYFDVWSETAVPFYDFFFVGLAISLSQSLLRHRTGRVRVQKSRIVMKKSVSFQPNIFKNKSADEGRIVTQPQKVILVGEWVDFDFVLMFSRSVHREVPCEFSETKLKSIKLSKTTSFLIKSLFSAKLNPLDFTLTFSFSRLNSVSSIESRMKMANKMLRKRKTGQCRSRWWPVFYLGKIKNSLSVVCWVWNEKRSHPLLTHNPGSGRIVPNWTKFRWLFSPTERISKTWLLKS